MQYRRISQTSLSVSPLSLGTWAFGSDRWWGHQDDRHSLQVMEIALHNGINLFDTAPVYGRGHSEEIIGQFIAKNNLREKIVLASKLGLAWETNSPRILHNLSPQQMIKELDLSRKRLNTDYIDIYQVHWPDPDTPISQTAQTMHSFWEKGIIKAVGVSNFSVEQMQQFLKHCPIHSLQPPYNMFKREIEDQIVPFCQKNNIALITYIPLHSGILTGKFHCNGVSIPKDICRRNHKDLKEPAFSINKEIIVQLQTIAQKYNKTLTQLVLAWTMHQPGITSVITGARNAKQIKENLGSVDWHLTDEDQDTIHTLLNQRLQKIEEAKKS